MARHYIHLYVHSQRDRLSISVSAASSWQVNQPKQAMAIRAARSKVYSHDTKLLFSSDFTVICCCLQVHFIPIHIYTSIVYNSYMHVYTIYIQSFIQIFMPVVPRAVLVSFLHFYFLVLIFDYQLQLSRGYQKQFIVQLLLLRLGDSLYCYIEL